MNAQQWKKAAHRQPLLTLVRTTVVLVSLLAAPLRSEASEAGDLDTSFGVNGFAITDFGGTDRAAAMAMQQNGRIVAAGRAELPNRPRDVAIARYTADGMLDPHFGEHGKTMTSRLHATCRAETSTDIRNRG